MKELNASPGRILSIGYESEDNVTKIIFRYDLEWLSYGDGAFKIRVLRHGDTEAYNATQVVDDREAMTLTMTVTDIELSVKGHGEMQVVYIGGNFVKKSPIYRYNVSRAIDSEIVNPPQGSIINELVQSVGDLGELTTTDKSSLVSAINEVNTKEGGGGGSVTVDDELSGTSENPVQNKVVKAHFDGLDQTVAGIGGRLSTAETALTGKADKSYVDTELSSKANTADINTALAGKVSTADMNTALAGKANTADMNTALSAKANTADMNTALALKANSSDVQAALAGKASTDVATQSANGLMSSADKTKLDGLSGGISDVQVNGTSVVSNGVAEIPIASTNELGVVKVNADRGIQLMWGTTLQIVKATSAQIKAGESQFPSIVPYNQHESAFYGLAKASGDTTQSASSNAVGTYTEEAKASIRTMLGLQDVYDDYSSALAALGVTES